MCMQICQGNRGFWAAHADLCVAVGALARGTFIGIQWRKGDTDHQKLFVVANADDKKRIVLVRCDADPRLFMGVHDEVEPPSLRTIPGRGFDFVMTHTVLQEVIVVVSTRE